MSQPRPPGDPPDLGVRAQSRLIDSAQDFGDAVRLVAENLDINEALVEKDHWVCEALRAIERAAPGEVVFKGGTSLEKLRLIQRFSEDLDLLVVGEYASPRATGRALKSMCAAAASAIPGAQPEKVDGGGTHPKSMHRAVNLPLPNPSEPDPGGLAQHETILIELGQSGGRAPSRRRSVSSLLSRQAEALGIGAGEFADIGEFDVNVLHPGRTLIEKLLRVNNFAEFEDRRNEPHWSSRIGRQFYDVWALLGNDEVRELLSDRDGAREIRVDCQNVSAELFKPDADPPAGGFASSAAFDPASDLAIELRGWHEVAMDRFYYGPSPAPTFDQVIKRVRKCSALLDI